MPSIRRRPSKRRARTKRSAPPAPRTGALCPILAILVLLGASFFWTLPADAASTAEITISVTVYQPPSPETFDLDLPGGWSLVSIPVEPTDSSRDAVFPPGEISAVWEYNNPGGYAIPTNIHPKKAYWIKANVAITLTVSGIRPTDTSVSLSEGWNMVGVVGPSSAQPWQPAPAVEAIWEYIPPYHIPTQCNEGRGFWIKASGPATIWPAP